MLTPNLSFPFLQPSQAQKHVTVNETLALLDALVQMGVESRSVATPPGAPTPGARYIVPPGANGGWAGHEGAVADWRDGHWRFLTPNPGWLVWVVDEAQFVVADGQDFQRASDVLLSQLSQLGLAASADASNRLVVNSPASLFTNDQAGHQLKINKATTTDTASLLFQSGFSGHAEIGLAGDDALTVKVSDNGQDWQTAIQVDPADASTRVRQLRSLIFSVDNDGAIQIPTPAAGGLFAFAMIDDVFPQASHSGLFAYDVGATLSLVTLASASSVVNHGAAALTGTFGPPAKTGIAVAPSNLVFENRFGTNRKFSLTFLC